MSGIRNLDIGSKSFSAKEQKELKFLDNLIKELNSREIPDGILKRIDTKIAFLNNTSTLNKDYKKAVKATKREILKWLEKELKLVPRNYYATIWTSLGMSAFGLPIGTALFAITDNPAFIGVGLPIGLGMGSMHGASLDKKAEAEGRVLKLSE